MTIKRRRSRAEIKQLVAEYEASGMGRTAFCQQRGLSLSTLTRYPRRREQTAGEAAAGKAWLAVEVSGSTAAEGGARTSSLTVVLPGGRRIDVRAAESAEAVVLGWQRTLGLRQTFGEGALPLASGGSRRAQSGAQPGGMGAAGGRHRFGEQQTTGVVSESS